MPRKLCVFLILPLLLQGRPSVDDVHNRNLHGPSVRHLHEKMATKGRYGAGELSEDDLSILFLRYQREFNRTLASGVYTHQTMTQAYESFKDSARRLATMLASPEGPGSRGLELALNEISDVSEDEWEAVVETARRRLVMPFAPPQRRQERAVVRGKLDWRAEGMLSNDVLSLDRSRRHVPMDLSRLLLPGTVEAKALCLDALYIRSNGGNSSALPPGGFGHLARLHPELAEALGAGPAAPRGWGQRPDERGAGFTEGPLQLPPSFASAAQSRAHTPFRDSVTFVDEQDGSGARGEEEGDTDRERVLAALVWVGARELVFKAVPAGDELLLQVALQNEGVVAVALDMSDPVLQFYRAGLYTGGQPRCQQRGPTHALGLIGFEESEAAAYWVLQNAWGRSWGANGTMALGKGGNVCGVATSAVFAVDKGPKPPPE